MCIFDYLDLELLDGVVDVNRFLERCEEIQNKEWNANLTSKPKLRSYVQFKHKVCIEPYVYNNINKSTRSLIAQFRTGVLPLFVETGRYDKTPLDKRICKLCSQKVVEDESHFLCTCTAYAHTRLILYDKIRNIDNLFDTFVNEKDIFNYIMKHHQLFVSKYVSDAWSIRKSLMYTKT